MDKDTSRIFFFWRWQRLSVDCDWKNAALHNSVANSVRNDEVVFPGINVTD
jgi:hypothetical protein